MRLYCISRYRSAAGAWSAGQELDVTDEAAEFLLRDSPGSFSFDRPTPAAKPKRVSAPSGQPDDGEEDETAGAVETEHAAGTTTNVRPQRKGSSR